jgi:hypothetical protein
VEEAVPSNSAPSEQMVDGDFDNTKIEDNGVQCLEATEEPNQDKQSIALKKDIQEQSPNPLELLTWSEKLSLRFKALDGYCIYCIRFYCLSILEGNFPSSKYDFDSCLHVSYLSTYFIF